MRTELVVAVLLAFAPSAFAGQGTAASYLQGLEREAASLGGFAGFSAARGERFFKTVRGDWACATCHTKDPLDAGQHARTGRDIAPLAPAANPERFADARKTDKWFRRNCNDVLGRSCTALEKGDVLVWLMSLK